MNLLNLSSAVLQRQPFPCFRVNEAISEELERVLLQWLEADAPWRLAVMDFYEQYEFDFKNVTLPAALELIVAESTLVQLRNDVGSVFGTSLKPQIDVTAHKLKRSQRIRIHNDSRPDGETHRLLIQLNRGWDDANGGLLMLFRGSEVETLDQI